MKTKKEAKAFKEDTVAANSQVTALDDDELAAVVGGRTMPEVGRKRLADIELDAGESESDSFITG